MCCFVTRSRGILRRHIGLQIFTNKGIMDFNSLINGYIGEPKCRTPGDYNGNRVWRRMKLRAMACHEQINGQLKKFGCKFSGMARICTDFI